jgi:c-di-GMP-binding flagellar brake protein YcgR
MDQATTTPASTATEQKRQAPRQRVLKAGKIILENLTGLDCQLRDISETGAKLLVGNGALLPKHFRLIVTADNTIRDVEVTWRKSDSVGVVFKSAPKPSALRKI